MFLLNGNLKTLKFRTFFSHPCCSAPYFFSDLYIIIHMCVCLSVCLSVTLCLSSFHISHQSPVYVTFFTNPRVSHPSFSSLTFLLTALSMLRHLFADGAFLLTEPFLAHRPRISGPMSHRFYFLKFQ